MKHVMLDIPNNKFSFFMELIKSFPYVKAKPLSSEKSLFIEEFKEAIEEFNAEAFA